MKNQISTLLILAEHFIHYPKNKCLKLPYYFDRHLKLVLGFSEYELQNADRLLSAHLARVVVVITPLLPKDGGTARTEIQVHVVNLIEIKLGERWQPNFEPVMSDR